MKLDCSICNLIRALTFYAEIRNWKGVGIDSPNVLDSRCFNDQGFFARKILNEASKRSSPSYPGSKGYCEHLCKHLQENHETHKEKTTKKSNRENKDAKEKVNKTFTKRNLKKD